ncbi:MAG: VCBS repeat-containing protein, partial [Candidatus Eisenbacteria bacterium]|nr:VCBS repeat-containing protein [Candidatus Eisenbacteria bacterium]
APGGAIDVWSCPAIADLDGDGEMEIVAGDYDGYCRAFHRDGSTVAGWPVDVNIMNTYPGWCLSSPATADLDGDGRDEVVIGSDDDRLFVIQGDGTFFPGWPRVIPFGFRASPALGDLDGDGDLEIVIGHRTSAGDLRLYALHHDGSMVSGWPVAQAAGGGGYTFGWLSPVLADLTGDGRPEVIAVKERRVANPDQAEIWAFGPNGGAALPGFPISLEGLAYGMPVIDDFDRDGLAEILIGDLTRRLYKFDLSQPIIADREPFEWRRLQKDLVHTGRFVVRNPEGNEEGRDLGGSGRPAAWVAAPNPFVDQVRLMPAGRGENGSGGETGIGIGSGTGTGATGGWTVLDAQGRRVRALRGSRPVWDGRNDAGHAAAPGIYFAYPDGSGGTRGFVRLLRLR